ncbi:signal peptidase I [Halomarina litorea]|uniref:signal peptidase I n=1 Tax=Halomarina litorea TaxID=2961595 RepID=UPI0034A58116
MLKRAGLVVVGLLCLLALMPATAPVQLSYVYSGSMEPTIHQYDGYLLVPASDVDVGDIVTFWSPERNSYTTHRIVGQSEHGFITKGDANPSTDQAGGASYVRPDEIRGRVLAIHGNPVVIPGLGHAVRFIQAHRIQITSLLGLVLLLGGLRERTPTRPSRSVPRVRDVLWPIFAVAVISAIGLQFIGGHTEQLTYVALDSGASGPNRLTVGEPTTETLVINRSTVPLTAYMVSADGMAITNQTRNASTITVSVRIPPPSQTGVVTTSVTVNRYVTVLPIGVIRRLHRIHPLLAGSATVGVIMFPIMIAMFVGIDGKRPVRSVESRSVRALKRRWREL